MDYSKKFNFALPSSNTDTGKADINDISNNFKVIDERVYSKEEIDKKNNIITIASIDLDGRNYFNYPVNLDTTKKYNATLLFEYIEAGSTERIVKYFENVSFVGGALRISADNSLLIGAIIYANKFYDASIGEYINKSGWVGIKSNMEASSSSPYKFVIALAEVQQEDNV